jgi:hypothetical protein
MDVKMEDALWVFGSKVSSLSFQALQSKYKSIKATCQPPKGSYAQL